MALPDGIDADDIPDGTSWQHRTSWLSLAILGAFMALVASGLLGGVPRPVHSVTTPAVALHVRSPDVIRNGEFFETEIVVEARQRFSKLVIGVSPELWQNITVNTFIPAASEESFENGAFRFDYGPLEAGERLVVKIDSQINPALVGGTGGAVTVSDDKTQRAALPLAIRVLP